MPSYSLSLLEINSNKKQHNFLFKYCAEVKSKPTYKTKIAGLSTGEITTRTNLIKRLIEFTDCSRQSIIFADRYLKHNNSRRVDPYQ